MQRPQALIGLEDIVELAFLLYDVDMYSRDIPSLIMYPHPSHTVSLSN